MKLTACLALLSLLLTLAACGTAPVNPADSDTTDTADSLDTPDSAASQPGVNDPDMLNDFHLVIHDPVVISQDSAVSVKGRIPWGTYQFPGAFLSWRNSIAVTFSAGPDDAASYGIPSNKRLSWNGGETWIAPMAGYNFGGGLQLENGDRLSYSNPASLDPSTLDLPDTPDATRMFWNYNMRYYLASRFDEEINSFTFVRYTKDGKTVTEKKYIELPENYLRSINTNVFVQPHLHDLKLAPDGDVWAIAYLYFDDGYDGRVAYNPVFMVSEDNGETFTYRSMIPYEPDPAADPQYKVRDGFAEPAVCFLPNGDIMCLMRTHDQHNIGPMYVSYSSDNGYTWSKPEVFDTFGVMAKTLTLDCGVTLASYGRPGVAVRATDDPTGRIWQDAVKIIDTAVSDWTHPGQDTCGGTSLVPLSETEALLVYSDFQYPDEEGVLHKTILCRKIEIVVD